MVTGSTGDTRTAANRLGLDYRAEAGRLGVPAGASGRGIVDSHAHINGARAAELYREVCELYGVTRTYSQTQLAEADRIGEILGDRVRFVAIPEYMATDKKRAFREGFYEGLDEWWAKGARMVKFWTAPRFLDFAEDFSGGDASDLWPADAPWRMRIAEKAVGLGMMLMVHVADPDTWFRAKYADAKRYGSKADQWAAMSRFLDAFDVPCLGAHMGGWPEDLGRLTEILERHPKLVLDTSATKWMVRELSAHPREELVAFLRRFEGRILFGSDIVTHDDHLTPSDPNNPKFGNQLANSRGEAFELYASRYWAQRVMWETDYDGESNIADPDLAMVEPERFTEMDGPRLVGRALPGEMLDVLYRSAAEKTLDAWYERGEWGG